MRIVAGIYRSRQLMTPKGQSTRPTADKVKGAIFSSLGGSFSGGRMLDCYSGTGNMALEAISRGMEYAVCVDKDPRAVSVIKANVKNLQVEKQVQIINADIFSALRQCTAPFDLIYIDPPYRKEDNIRLIHELLNLGLIQENGRLVIESLSEQTWPERIGDLIQTKDKVYRNTRITYFRKESQHD